MTVLQVKLGVVRMMATPPQMSEIMTSTKTITQKMNLHLGFIVEEYVNKVKC